MKSIRNFFVNSNHDWSGEFESPELKLSDESIRKTKWRGGGARFKHSQLSATTRSWSAVKVFTANFDFIVKSWTDSVVLFSTQILFGSGILKWIRGQWSNHLIFVVKTANFDKNEIPKFWFCVRRTNSDFSNIAIAIVFNFKLVESGECLDLEFGLHIEKLYRFSRTIF